MTPRRKPASPTGKRAVQSKKVDSQASTLAGGAAQANKTGRFLMPVLSPLFRELWAAIDAARLEDELAPAVLAKRAGFSRSSWFNYQSGASPITLQALESLAVVLRRHLRISFGGKICGVGESTSVDPATGGLLNMDDATQEMAAIMEALSPTTRRFVIKVMHNALAVRGFRSPPGGGAAPRRPK